MFAVGSALMSRVQVTLSTLKYLINFLRYRRTKFNIKYAEQASIITQWDFLWRNEVFLFFDDVHYLQKGKTYRNNSLTVAIFLNKAVFSLIFSTKRIKILFQDNTKSCTPLEAPWWAEFRSHFQNWNISSTFWDVVERNLT